MLKMFIFRKSPKVSELNVDPNGGVQNAKEQVSSYKILDLAVIQSSATNLMNFTNPKSIKGNQLPKFSDGPPKMNQGT